MGRERRTTPFVGRADELERLERALTHAIEGEPRIVLISGEAGVGKTRLADELLRRADAQGATVLTGVCHEDLSVPYLPIASALRPLLTADLDAGDRSALAQILDPGSDAGAVAKPADAERGRLVLYFAVDRALFELARSGPIVLFIDDVHWADDATLDLLSHLTSSIAHDAAAAGLPIMLIVTHRHLDRHDRVARTVERFEREPGAMALALRGLDELEVNDLVASIAPARPSRRLLHAIVEATEGNPLLVRGVVTTMLREGATVEAGELRADAGEIALRGATLLDEEIGWRLHGVGSSCHELLTVAAFLGDGGAIIELAAVLGEDQDALSSRLDDAAEAQLLVDDGDRYWFEHPQVRQVLYHQPRARQREAMHRRIANALEVLYRDDLERRALPIAHHLARAGKDVDRDRLLRWSRLAGDQAWAVAAWAEAGRCYDVAVDALGAPGQERWEEVADLHLSAGWADFHNFDLPSATAHLATVVGLARDHGDLRRWGEALLPLMRFHAAHAIRPGDRFDLAPAEDFLAAAGDKHPDLRALVLGLLGEIAASTAYPRDAAQFLGPAHDLLPQVDDPWVVSLVEFATGLAAMRQLDLDTARDAFSRSTANAELTEDVWRQRTAMGRLPLVSTLAGNLPAAVNQALAARTHNERWHLRGELTLATAELTALAVAQSRYADAERAGSDTTLLFHRSGYIFAPGVSQPALAAGRAARGDAVGAHEALHEWDEGPGRGIWRYRQAVDCWCGDVDVVRSQVDARPWPALPDLADSYSIDAAVILIEVAAALGDGEMAQRAVPLLEAAWGHGVRWTIGWPGCIPRLLGVAATLDRRFADAERWFGIARPAAIAAEAAGEAARVDLDHAAALLADPAGDRERGQALADRASRAFDELGMLTFLLAARRLGGHRTVAGEAPESSGLRVILYSDIVGSTQLNIRAGDQAYVELLREHNRIVRDRLRRHDGVEFKHTGDGICAWFSSATSAVECALAIRDDLDRFSSIHPELPLTVRIGMAAGEPIGEDGDLFGLTVVAAGRICAAAGTGRVWVAEEIPKLVRGSSLRFAEVGEVSLKGFPEPFRLHEALTPA